MLAAGVKKKKLAKIFKFPSYLLLKEKERLSSSAMCPAIYNRLLLKASCLTKCLMEVSFSITGVTLKGKDTLTALTYQNKLTIFSRSITKASQLYWAQEVNGNWSDWTLIGGSSVSLKSDVAVAYNGFSKVRIPDFEIWVKR